MALAPGHLLGQIIGLVMEQALKPVLQEMADQHDLYLDSYGPRPGVRIGPKVKWEDNLGNTHDLDFVLERGGSAGKAGNPAAFIESAWRRYTKHSRAKAQEIQGAVLPVLAKWNNVKPIPAAFVAGEWSAPSLKQMETSGFTVLRLTFSTMADVFRRAGMDIVGLGEDTPDEYWQQQCDAYNNMSDAEESRLILDLTESHKEEFAGFVSALESRVVRSISYVTVTPIHGASSQYQSVADAISAVLSYSRAAEAAPFIRFEVRIIYTNGDDICASFAETADAISFLDTFA